MSPIPRVTQQRELSHDFICFREQTHDFPSANPDGVVCASTSACCWVWLYPTRLCPEDFINILHAIGVPAAFFAGWATIIVEFIGGIMILLGAFVPLATIPMIVVLIVAIVSVHLPNGFSSIKLQSFDAAGAHFGQPGYETDLLYIAALIALCLGGAGPISVDGRLSRLRSTS
jgi:uncharacterized membrane protein YphA (DoxX/SURF4 family)